MSNKIVLRLSEFQHIVNGPQWQRSNDTVPTCEWERERERWKDRKECCWTMWHIWAVRILNRQHGVHNSHCLSLRNRNKYTRIWITKFRYFRCCFRKLGGKERIILKSICGFPMGISLPSDKSDESEIADDESIDTHTHTQFAMMNKSG